MLAYHSNLGKETLNQEFKQFTLNFSSKLIDTELAEELVRSYEFCFTNEIKKNIESYIENYLPKYVSSIINPYSTASHLNFYIGVDNDGTVIGIPFQGILTQSFVDDLVHKVITKRLSYPSLICWKKYVNVELIRITKPAKPFSQNYKVERYFAQKKETSERFNDYINKLTIWRNRIEYYSQKLVDLANQKESRANLIAFIKSLDSNNPVIKLLESNWEMPHKNYEEIAILKNSKFNPYYWVIAWKDYMIEQLKKDKPTFNEFLTMAIHPTNLIISMKDMIPYWMNYNVNMNLYVIRITITKPINPEITLYQELMTEKWLRCYRTDVYGEPACLRY